MTLTRKGEATKQRIVEGAAGYLRSADAGEVTLDDIRAITRTSKGQLFHYFPGGKEELLLAVAAHEADRVLEDQQPHLGDLSTWEAWARWRDAVVQRYRKQGTQCPLASLMGQVGGTPGAAEVVTVLLAEWQRRLQVGIEEMQSQGLVSPAVKSGAIAGALIAGIQGGVQVLRSTGSTEQLEASIDVLLDYLRLA